MDQEEHFIFWDFHDFIFLCIPPQIWGGSGTIFEKPQYYTDKLSAKLFGQILCEIRENQAIRSIFISFDKIKRSEAPFNQVVTSCQNRSLVAFFLDFTNFPENFRLEFSR